MFPLFGSLKNLVKFQNIEIDNTIFQLHYKATVLILAACSIALSTRQFLGDPIHCTLPSEEIGSSIIDSYCWIHSTFTLPGTVKDPVDSHVVYPGVDKYDVGDEVMHHAYYQWVCFFLVIQCVMFYVPRWLWKNWENNRITHLVLDLDKPMLKDTDKNTEDRTMLSEYIYEMIDNNDSYAYKYFACEFFNFVNVVGQIFLIDVFLGGEFTSYGPRVIAFMETDQENREDPMIQVFPRVTKCTFRTFGSSGDIQKHDSLCVLPLNIINEKIYVFLWFWFVFLAVFTALACIYRLVVMLLPGLRYQVLKSKAKTCDSDKLSKVLRLSSVGDWFLLYLLAKNMESNNFKDMIEDVHSMFEDDLVKKMDLTEPSKA